MNRNESLFNRAKAIIPGGVNSPVRAFGSVGGVPRFIKKAEGAYVWDETARVIPTMSALGALLLSAMPIPKSLKPCAKRHWAVYRLVHD